MFHVNPHAHKEPWSITEKRPWNGITDYFALIALLSACTDTYLVAGFRDVAVEDLATN